MQVSCDRCEGPTKPKDIVSKKNGKQYTIYECQGSCMNGRFKYTCFPPRESEGTKAKVSSGGEAVSLLKDIAGTLRRIEKILANPKGVSVAEDELSPDEEVPF